MASAAPITGASADAPPRFTINGAVPFQNIDAGDYIRAAHAVACLGAGNGGDNQDLYSTDALIIAGFDAIALLLAHAERRLEGERG